MNHTGFGRRDFLRMGSLGVLSSALHAGSGNGMSCIVIWQGGGCSHLDTFDMKPGAPREVRGEFRPVATNVPGIQICEHLPLTARHADKLTIVRSMCFGETNHERALHLLETGLPLSPGRQVAGLERIATRGGRSFTALPAAFEPRKAGEAYGDTPLGRECLMARRAIEAGRRFVAIGKDRRVYDTHADNFRVLKDAVLPEFDRAFSALLEDLAQRGLLRTTLVAVMGEFGRSPVINSAGGRDHHASAWSVVLAGAGLPGGRVIGATDRTGREVADTPVSPADLVRTLEAILGAAPEAPFLAAGSGRVMKELFA